MNWIIASLLMIVSSVALYLFVRKSHALKTPRELNNLAMFLVPLLVYGLLIVTSKTSLMLEPFEYLLVLIQGVLFTYAGNVMSLKGIEHSPNPGYSLIISKSYVVFTTVASVFIFAASLNIKTVMAIVLIIFFSTLIMFDGDVERKGTSNMWLWYF